MTFLQKLRTEVFRKDSPTHAEELAKKMAQALEKLAALHADGADPA
jgi:hypothetical protein